MIRFLTNWLKLLGNFIVNIFSRNHSKSIIPENFNENELIIRGIYSPIFYSARTGRLREGAFMPPPSKRDVSVLRKNYTNDNFCKNHCIKVKIQKNNYCGLASFLTRHIAEIAKEYQMENLVFLKFTPLDENYGLIQSRPILITTPGIPMHADIYYNGEFENGKPQTQFRQFAKKLANEISNYFDDPFPDVQNWNGPILTWQPKVAI